MSNEELLENLKEIHKPTEELRLSLLDKIDFKIDNEYLNYILSKNGSEGFLGKNYLSLYGIDDLIALNPYYEGEDFCNEIFVIGSNGADNAFAIKKQNTEFIVVPFLGMDGDSAKTLGGTFNEFLNYLYSNEIVS